VRLRGLLAVLVVWLPAVQLNGQADIAPRASTAQSCDRRVDTHDDSTERLIFDKAFDRGPWTRG